MLSDHDRVKPKCNKAVAFQYCHTAWRKLNGLIAFVLRITNADPTLRVDICGPPTSHVIYSKRHPTRNARWVQVNNDKAAGGMRRWCEQGLDPPLEGTVTTDVKHVTVIINKQLHLVHRNGDPPTAFPGFGVERELVAAIHKSAFMVWVICRYSKCYHLVPLNSMCTTVFVLGSYTNSQVPLVLPQAPGTSQRKPPGIPGLPAMPGSGMGFPAAIISRMVSGDLRYGRVPISLATVPVRLKSPAIPSFIPARPLTVLAAFSVGQGSFFAPPEPP